MTSFVTKLSHQSHDAKNNLSIVNPFQGSAIKRTSGLKTRLKFFGLVIFKSTEIICIIIHTVTFVLSAIRLGTREVKTFNC